MTGGRGTQTKAWAQGFGLLSDPTRLDILQILAQGPRNVTALCEALGLKQPTVSHHLGLLRREGLVIDTRAGKSVIYETNRARLGELMGALAALMPR